MNNVMCLPQRDFGRSNSIIQEVMFHTERGKEETASKGKGEKRRKLTLYKVKLSVHYNHVEVIRMKQMETKERTEEVK